MSTSAEIIIDKMLSQFHDKSLITAIIKAVGNRLDEVKAMQQQLRDERWVDTAVGIQLDGCGNIVSMKRKIDNSIAINYFGFPNHGDKTFGTARFRRYAQSYLASSTLQDEEYRTAIYGKIAKNTATGNHESMLASLKMLFGNNAKVKLYDGGNATVRVYIGRIVYTEEMRMIDSLNLMVKSAGVGITFIGYYNADNVFGFSRTGEPIAFKTFGQGSFARIIRT